MAQVSPRPTPIKIALKSFSSCAKLTSRPISTFCRNSTPSDFTISTSRNESATRSFVSRNSIRVQSAGKFSPVKYGHAVTLSRKKRRARQGRRPRPDAGHAAPIRLARVEQPNVAVQHMVHGESLQPANLDRLLALFDHDARAFAQHFRRANSPAAFAENIRFQNHARRPAHIRRHDALDKAGHIDPRRARLNARSVKTIRHRADSIAACRAFNGGVMSAKFCSYFSGDNFGAVSRRGIRSPRVRGLL